MTRDIKRLKLSWSKREEHKHSTESKIVKEHGLVVVQNYEKDQSNHHQSHLSPSMRTELGYFAPVEAGFLDFQAKKASV